MKRMPVGTVSSGRSSASREMMAGTALIHVTRRSADELPEPGAVETVVEDEGRASHERGEQPDDLCVDVEERQRVEAAIVRREVVVRHHAAGGVQQLRLSQTGHLGRPGRTRRREDDAAASGCRRVPSPPGRRRMAGASSSNSIQPAGNRPPRGAVGQDRRAPRFGPARCRARSGPASGVAGSSGATHRPEATAPRTAAAQDSGSAIDTATVVPGVKAPAARARRHCSSEAKLRTRSLRASSA